ncbi:hypothetical protein IQ07DRAFT_585852 [Pyrenochaeta sp. DS3sAY3a]|nr:hypothetical protein IQ07DRAFT_585852 [Pyrenochaeta sp. DS3sAY3a]
MDQKRRPAKQKELEKVSSLDIPQVERSLTCQSRIISPTEFALDWLLKVLAVASAILFGIWAPISYRLQDLGNKSNDEAQDKLVAKLESMGKEIEGMKAQLNGLAILRALDFCTNSERKALDACQALQGHMNVNALLSNLAPPAPESSPAPSVSSTESVSYSTIVSRTLDAVPAPTITGVPNPEATEDDESQHDELDDWYPGYESTKPTPPIFASPTSSSHPSALPGGGDLLVIGLYNPAVQFYFVIVGGMICGVLLVEGFGRWKQRQRRDQWRQTLEL